MKTLEKINKTLNDLETMFNDIQTDEKDVISAITVQGLILDVAMVLKEAQSALRLN